VTIRKERSSTHLACAFLNVRLVSFSRLSNPKTFTGLASTPLLLYSSTPLLLYSSTPLLLYSSTPLLLYSSTPPPDNTMPSSGGSALPEGQSESTKQKEMWKHNTWDAFKVM